MVDANRTIDEHPAAVAARNAAALVRKSKDREVRRARAAEALLREGERLLRNNPDMQKWRAKVGEHLATYRDYEQREPDAE